MAKPHRAQTPARDFDRTRAALRGAGVAAGEVKSWNKIPPPSVRFSHLWRFIIRYQ